MRNLWLSVILLLLLGVVQTVLPLVPIDLLNRLLDPCHVYHWLLLFRVGRGGKAGVSLLRI